jgi:hypothetical protein
VTTNGNADLESSVQGQPYALVSVPNCRTCQSPLRPDIERALVTGRSYSGIARQFPQAGLSARNIGEHFRRGHLPVRDEALRRLAEERAAQIARDIDEGAGIVVDQVLFARAVVQRSFERLASGDAVPDIREGLAAARLLADFDDTATQVEAQALFVILTAYVDEMEKVASPEQMAAWAEACSKNPEWQRVTEIGRVPSAKRQAEHLG